MDEAAAWRRLQEVEHGSGYFRGYGIYLWLIWQSVAQQKKYYGRDNLLDETMDVLIYGRPKTSDGADFIQEMLGDRTEMVHKRSMAGGRFAIVAPQAQDTIDPMKMPVLSKKEIMQIEKDRYIVFYNGRNYYLRKWEYFKNPTLAKRARIPYIKSAEGHADPSPIFVREALAGLSEDQLAMFWNEVANQRRLTGRPPLPADAAGARNEAAPVQPVVAAAGEQREILENVLDTAVGTPPLPHGRIVMVTAASAQEASEKMAQMRVAMQSVRRDSEQRKEHARETELSHAGR